MSSRFRFLMLGAMYENGGNTTHRFLDGHPQMYVYPYESQIGTRMVNDHMSSLFPVKYRWPVFALDATPEQDYHAIIDEEGKIRSKTPHVSKFRHMPFELTDKDRCAAYCGHIKQTGRSRANNVAAFFKATFDAWKDYKKTGRQEVYVGYSPIIGVDADKILTDCPDAHVLHVVRNPWSAYADTKKRAVPLALVDYMLGWTLNQYYALLLPRQVPGPDARRTRRGRDGRLDAHARPGVRRAGCRAGRLAQEADLERRTAQGSLPVGHDPHADALGKSRHGRGTVRRRAGRNPRPHLAVPRNVRLQGILDRVGGCIIREPDAQARNKAIPCLRVGLTTLLCEL